MREITCYCGKKKMVKAWNAKTCSAYCNTKYYRIHHPEYANKTKIAWRRKNGILEHGSIEHRNKMADLSKGKNIGITHAFWKGSKVGYRALHLWVVRQLGKIKECVFCGNEGRIEWASISHQAKRDINDFIPLCVPCHRNYDKKGIVPSWQ